MRTFTLLMFITLLLLATTATAVDYWPDEIGATFSYVDAEDGYKILSIESGQVGGDVRYDWSSHAEGQNCVGYEEWVFDSGTANLLGRMQDCEGWMDEEVWTYSPAVQYVNGTMNVGDTWETVTQATSSTTIERTYVMEVVAAETITVPAGTFDTLKLVVQDSTNLSTRTYWLERDLGPVKTTFWELQSWTGIVGDEDLNWGGVKALYR